MSHSPEELLRSFQAGAAEHVERAQLLSRQLEKASATVESTRGEVRVTVDSTGGLANLQFGATARGLSLDQLAELVLSTSRQAQSKLAASMNEVASQLYGPGSETARFLSDVYAERFPAPADDQESDQR